MAASPAGEAVAGPRGERPRSRPLPARAGRRSSRSSRRPTPRACSAGRGQDDVVRWAADHPTSVKRLGTYRPERAALADLLDRAAVPPEEREDFLRRLLLRVPAEDRDAELARRIGGEDAEARVRRALASPDPSLTFAPILTPDAEPSGEAARPFVVAGTTLRVGDLVRARRPGGEVEAGEVEDLRPGSDGLPWTATVRFAGGDVDRAVAPSQIADVGRREGAGIDARRSFGVEAPSASVAGVELRPGDRVSWDSGGGRRTRARVVRIIRDRDPNADGESWLAEALTEPREGRPATRVLLAPGRAKSLQTEGRPDTQRPPAGGRVDGPPRGLPSPPTLERRARLLRHFELPPETLVVPVADLLPSRVDPAEKVDRAAAHMADAAGGGGKRAPLLVRLRGDGTYRVLDGNATLAAAERVGLSELPVLLEPGARSPGTLPTGEDIDRIVQAAFRRGDRRSGAVVAAQAALSAIGMPLDGYSVRTGWEPSGDAHARISIRSKEARELMVEHRDYLTSLGFNVIDDLMIGSFRYSDLRTEGARRPSPLEEIAARHPEVELDAFERHDQGIVISLIRVPEGRRNRGLATAALEDVLAYADATGQVVAVTPDPIVKTPGGLSKSRLTAWYASHGFRSNKGRKIDFRFRETMIRDPKVPEGARSPASPPARTLWHGLTKGELSGELRAPLYLSYDEGLALAYGDDDRGRVVGIDVAAAANPLALDTPQKFAAAWAESGAGDVPGRFHPDSTRAFADWARGRGHDVVEIPATAFDDSDHAAWEAGPTGLFGEPQVIVLDPGLARIVPSAPSGARSPATLAPPPPLEVAAEAAKEKGVDVALAFAAADAGPVHPKRSEYRMRAAAAILDAGEEVKDAVLQLPDESAAREPWIARIATGDVARAQHELRETPLADLEVLGRIRVESHPRRPHDGERRRRQAESRRASQRRSCASPAPLAQ